jgi:hypothetical protein
MPLTFRHVFPDDDDPIFTDGFVIGFPVRGKKPSDTEAASEPTSPPRATTRRRPTRPHPPSSQVTKAPRLA